MMLLVDSDFAFIIHVICRSVARLSNILQQGLNKGLPTAPN